MSWKGDEEQRPGGEDADEELDENVRGDPPPPSGGSKALTTRSQDYKTHKDAVLFAIDVSSSMLQPPAPVPGQKKADKDSAVVAALKCAYQIMQQRIIAQPNDMMGILLYNTDKSKFRQDSNPHGGAGYPHCYLLSDLDVPGAEDVKMLKEMVEEEEDPDEVLVPSDEPALMSNVLFCANQIFTTNAPNFGSRRLFIITDNDNPHAGDKHAKSSAAVRAKDLYDLGVIIELFPISRSQNKFDLTQFYDVGNPLCSPTADLLFLTSTGHCISRPRRRSWIFRRGQDVQVGRRPDPAGLADQQHQLEADPQAVLLLPHAL